jgi:hypothetical protein
MIEKSLLSVMRSLLCLLSLLIYFNHKHTLCRSYVIGGGGGGHILSAMKASLTVTGPRDVKQALPQTVPTPPVRVQFRVPAGAVAGVIITIAVPATVSASGTLQV